MDLDDATQALRSALRGDCHSHSDWSDGGSPIEEMALAAVGLGHEYLVVTDHSPRLTVANGLTASRLRRQLDLIAAINDGLPPGFRLLTGIEVDILADGSLDQDPELLSRLDVVVGSVHSGLRDDSAAMTRRMLAAIANPHLDILGHCTGRRLAVGRAGGDDAPGESAGGGSAGRPAGGPRAGGPGAPGRPGPAGEHLRRGGRVRRVREHDKAVEINCRPDRLDPPKRLLRLAVEAGLPVLHRHRRARSRAARLAAQRLRTRGALRGAGGARGQHLARGAAAGVGRRPRNLTRLPGRLGDGFDAGPAAGSGPSARQPHTLGHGHPGQDHHRADRLVPGEVPHRARARRPRSRTPASGR